MTASLHHAFTRLAAWRRRDRVRHDPHHHHHQARGLTDAQQQREVARAQPRSLIDPLR